MAGTAAYDALTPENQAILQAFTNLVRGWSGEQARVNNHGAAIDVDYVARVIDILNSFSSDDFIPNTSGLSGAASLSRADLVSIAAHIEGVQTNYNTVNHRVLWDKAAGTINLIG